MDVYERACVCVCVCACVHMHKYTHSHVHTHNPHLVKNETVFERVQKFFTKNLKELKHMLSNERLALLNQTSLSSRCKRIGLALLDQTSLSSRRKRTGLALLDQTSLSQKNWFSFT